MTIELIVQNGNNLYYPTVIDNIEWSTERTGSAGKLTFKILYDSKLNITEGNAVRLKVNGHGIFYGFIFKINSSQDTTMTITAYDQIIYLVKNKETYVFNNTTASKVIKKIASDFILNTGSIANTGYTIPSLTEDGQTLIDIVSDALDETITNKGKMFVLYDEFGKLTLKDIADMKVNILIDGDTAQTYDYTSSIDDNTYNKVKLVFDNKDTGKRDVYLTKDSSNINKWGVLQYYDTIQKGENGKAKADALLKLYNSKTRNLKVNKAFADYRIRAGVMVPVQLKLCDIKISNYMLVEKCKHTISNNEWFMDLTLRGGEFVA